MKNLFRRPSASMVVAIIALVVATTGTAIAAGQVSGDKLIKKNSLSGNRLRKHTVTGTQINLAKLGTVPSASKADSATSARSAVNAQSATSAQNAVNAQNATSAQSAVNAQNATTLGGKSLRWLLVDTTGTILAQSGGFTVAKVPSGRFIIDAGSAVSGHAFIVGNSSEGLASIGEASNAAPCGTQADALDCSSFAGAGANDGHHVFVGTSDAGGTAHDEPFYLLMY
jgi:hypothetical protein